MNHEIKLPNVASITGASATKREPTPELNTASQL